jgi:HD-like signal output (HDOD) protein
MTASAPAKDPVKLIASVIADVGDIATLPEITVRIIQIVENPKSTARDLHEIIRNDPALSTRILRVVNSAFYGLPGQIASIDRAIVLLGLSAVKNIAIAASMTHLFHGGGQIAGFNGAEVWKNSIAVAVAARLLTSAQGKPAVEESFLAGLIHNLGLLVIRQAFPKQLAEVLAVQARTGRQLAEIEAELIGADHQSFGMALATKWRFPQPLCTAIGYHHKPLALAPVNRELPTLVGLAAILACQAQIGFTAAAAGLQYGEEMLGVVRLSQGDVEAVAARLPEQVALTEAIFGG